jgi:hypothetical protein
VDAVDLVGIPCESDDIRSVAGSLAERLAAVFGGA